MAGERINAIGERGGIGPFRFFMQFEEGDSAIPLKGIFFMIAGGVFLTANDALLKWLTSDYPVGQIMFLRGIFVLIPLLIFVWIFNRTGALATRDLGKHLLRGGLMVCGTFLFVTGLIFLPLAEAISIAFAGPLFITTLAPYLLQEHVGLRRWIGVLIGFTGILIIFQPGTGVFQWAALLPLGASFTGALRDILTRKMSVSESSEALLLYSTIAVALGGLATAPFTQWRSVAFEDWMLFVMTGLLIGVAHFFMIEAFRFAQASQVAPFKYTSVLWALMIGYWIFGDLPTLENVIGAAVVISSGLYLFHRERVLGIRRVSG